MKLILTRDTLKDDCTLGTLEVGGKTFYTCEDAVREEKIPSMTAIPYGTYEVVITHSPRFNKVLPLLKDVPNFAGVRIHSGNTAADTEGCILIGKTRWPNGVGESRAAMAELMGILDEAAEPITIEIV